MAFTTVTNRTGPNSTILAEHHNEIIEYLSGLRNELGRLYSDDDSNYGVIIKNTGTGSKGLLVQDAVGATLLDVSSAGAVLGFAAGAAATPSIRASADTDTGIYFPAANSWGASVGGTARFRQYDTGSVAIYGGGIFIRKDGLQDQSATAMMTLANTTETAQGYGLASFDLYQTSPGGDNWVLRLVHRQTEGGGASQATLRGMEIETIREEGTTSLTNSAGNLGIELGTHLAARTASSIDSAGEPGYAFEAFYTNSGLFMFSSGDAWIPGAKFWRSGTGIVLIGPDGFDQHIHIRDVEDNELFVHDQFGRLRIRPAGFNGTGGIVYQWDGAAFNLYTVHAAASNIAGTGTVPTPTSTTTYNYIGSQQTFSHIRYVMSTIQSYGAGTPVVLVEYSTGEGTWDTIATRASAGPNDPGAAYTDGTDAFRNVAGTISYGPPSDWIKANVNGNSRYWVRISITGITASGGGQAETILPGTGEVVAIYPAPGDATPVFSVRHTGNIHVGPGPAYAAGARGGFLTIPTITGAAPTGVPLDISTRAALIFRTDTNVLYAFDPTSATWLASAAFT